MNTGWYFIGLLLGAINAWRRRLLGYGHPRPIAAADIDRNIKYDQDVVESLKGALSRYTGTEQPFLDKRILEIGPGPDLGTGIFIIAQGAREYTAVDRFPLQHMSKEFCAELAQKLHGAPALYPASERAEGMLVSIAQGDTAETFSYITTNGENLAGHCAPECFDCIVSQAALEHVENPKKVLEEMFRVLAPGGLMCHEIDFQTHSGFFRNRDPLNLYRYSRQVYKRWLSFPGSPNRMRPVEWEALARSSGLIDVRLIVLRRLDEGTVARVKDSLADPFRTERIEELGVLSAHLLARKP